LWATIAFFDRATTLSDSFIFRHFNNATTNAVPTIVAYDTTSATYVIGEGARQIVMAGRQGAQNFKRYIGDPDAAFEGKPGGKGTGPETRWLLRPDLSGSASVASTKEVTRTFLQTLFRDIGEVPKQLVIGLPTLAEVEWQENYRKHIRQIMAELGYGEPYFFPEPFAVFQYYRHAENLIPVTDHPLTVLVLDYGGGTLNCCIIETTQEGNLARGGATAVPIGVESVEGAGKEIDLRLLKLAVSKLKDPRLRKEPTETRVAIMPWALLLAEEIKIALANQMSARRLSDECSDLCEKRIVPGGYYHPDIDFEIVLTGEDLKQIVRELWMTKLGSGIVRTVKKAKYGRSGVRFTSLDKVILAGGSSGLPFLRELLAVTLAGEVEVRTKDIIIGKDFQKAVAFGLAIEAKEQRKRALRTNNSIGSCVFNPLYLYVAPSRRVPPEKPYVWRLLGDKKETHVPGTLLAGPMRLGGFVCEYEIKLPFSARGALFYWFCDSDDKADPVADRLNLQQDVLHTPEGTKKSLRLKLEFGENGLVKPIFGFAAHSIEGSSFLYAGLKLAREVDSFAGIDFGTSNTYVVDLWSEAKTAISQYPSFRISDSAGLRLRNLDQKIDSTRQGGFLRGESVSKYAAEKQSDFVFHSIKIEGSGLTRGETIDLLEGRKVANNPDLIVPVNVRDAYKFVLESANAYKETPEAFVREIHKIVLRNLSKEAGSYRKGPVKLSNVDYTPPTALEVPAFMQTFADELKNGPKGRSIVHFAAEAHTTLVAIHPFSDGNGRTGRLLMNAILIANGLPPAIIYFQDKERYLECLNHGDGGDLSSFSILLAETIDAALDEMRPRPEAEVKAATSEDKLPLKIATTTPSERLAEIVRKKAVTSPIEREARHKAWQAAFESFRQEFASLCGGFNDAFFKETLFRVTFRSFDTLPYEKYDALIRGLTAPRTWFFNVEISSETHSELFVFFFRSISEVFLKTGKKARLPKEPAPRDVTLNISRLSDGTYHRLENQPISLREIYYSDGQFLFLNNPRAGVFELVAKPSSDVVNSFLADVLEAFF
jgi:molecular chaperone DnaK (HSP70)/fido (protein-threonine AMPylation protein)